MRAAHVSSPWAAGWSPGGGGCDVEEAGGPCLDGDLSVGGPGGVRPRLEGPGVPAPGCGGGGDLVAGDGVTCCEARVSGGLGFRGRWRLPFVGPGWLSSGGVGDLGGGAL